MIRKIFLGADHGGFDLKEKIKKQLILASNDMKIEVEDLGTFTEESVDYPDFATKVARKIHGFQVVSSTPRLATSTQLPAECGILVCGSGQGMAMRANKFSHIRAALCWSEESAKLAREHNDANVLCLGGRLLDHEMALRMTQIFLTTHFQGDRHLRRVLKLSESTDS